VLVGADRRAISKELSVNRNLREKPTPYGEGSAAENIVEILTKRIYGN